MIGLKLRVVGSTLNVSKVNSITTNGRDQFDCYVETDSTWKNHSIHVRFNGITSVLVLDGYARIPTEVLKTTKLVIDVIGVNETSTYTTVPVTIQMIQGEEISSILDVPSPTEWEQYILSMDDIVVEVEENAELAKLFSDNASESASKSETMFINAQDAANKSEASARNAPFIGTNNNWYTYSASDSAMIDTGKSAVPKQTTIVINGTEFVTVDNYIELPTTQIQATLPDGTISVINVVSI